MKKAPGQERRPEQGGRFFRNPPARNVHKDLARPDDSRAWKSRPREAEA